MNRCAVWDRGGEESNAEENFSRGGATAQRKATKFLLVFRCAAASLRE